jgi:hypothetical protein
LLLWLLSSAAGPREVLGAAPGVGYQGARGLLVLRFHELRSGQDLVPLGVGDALDLELPSGRALIA